MTTMLNDVVNRVRELGFPALTSIPVLKHLKQGRVWIVRKQADVHGFAPRDTLMKQLKELNLWPS